MEEEVLEVHGRAAAAAAARLAAHPGVEAEAEAEAEDLPAAAEASVDLLVGEAELRGPVVRAFGLAASCLSHRVRRPDS